MRVVVVFTLLPSSTNVADDEAVAFRRSNFK